MGEREKRKWGEGEVRGVLSNEEGIDRCFSARDVRTRRYQ